MYITGVLITKVFLINLLCILQVSLLRRLFLINLLCILQVSLLRRFFDHIQDVKPHIFVTYNGDMFDWYV